MNNLRKTLADFGFVESSEDLVELWTSPRGSREEWIIVRFEDVFQKTVVQWEVHTAVEVATMPTPASVECLIAMMREMGIGVQP